MLQAVIDAWESMTCDEQALCYSLARRSTGKPVFESDQQQAQD